MGNINDMFGDLKDKTIIKNTNTNPNINNNNNENTNTIKKKKEKSNKKLTAFNLDKEVIEKLKEIAKKEDRSLSSLANVIFKEFIKNYDK
jgi:hypothetical protein